MTNEDVELLKNNQKALNDLLNKTAQLENKISNLSAMTIYKVISVILMIICTYLITSLYYKESCDKYVHYHYSHYHYCKHEYH